MLRPRAPVNKTVDSNGGVLSAQRWSGLSQVRQEKCPVDLRLICPEATSVDLSDSH